MDRRRHGEANVHRWVAVHLAGSVARQERFPGHPQYNSPTSLKLLCEKDFAEDG